MKTEFTKTDFETALANGAWAWPGGYPLYFITSDGESLSFDAAKANARLISEAIEDKSSCGWRVVGVDVNWEDADLRCCHSKVPIQSAYGEG